MQMELFSFWMNCYSFVSPKAMTLQTFQEALVFPYLFSQLFYDILNKLLWFYYYRLCFNIFLNVFICKS